MMLQLQELISYFENSALADNIRENDLLFPLIDPPRDTETVPRERSRLR